MRPFISLSCSREDDRLASKRLIRVLITPEENATNILPELFPWELPLPWAPFTVPKATAVCRERGDLAREFACAKDADASTSRGAGTSATARTRNACGKSAAGRRLAARLNVARTLASKCGMPRPRRSAGSEPKSRPRPLITPKLASAWSRSRKFFSLPLCDRPGCHEPPVTSPRNPACYCGAACRQAVRNVQDRERKWLWRGTSDGRKKRAIEYRAARQNRSLRQPTTAADVPPRAPPE